MDAVLIVLNRHLLSTHVSVIPSPGDFFLHVLDDCLCPILPYNVNFCVRFIRNP